MRKLLSLVCGILLLTACTVGPNYTRPGVAVPAKFKETPKGWKIAQPNDVFDRGGWWRVFNDRQLNNLEDQLNSSNQSIATAEAQYRQARALIDEARAAYYPILTGNVTVTRQRQVSGSTTFVSSSSSGITSSGAASVGAGRSSSTSVRTSHAWFLDAEWEPDLWGSIHRSVEADVAGANASAASLASIRLASQATLAQTYFQLRALDRDQQLLDNTVSEYKKSVQLTKNRYTAGVAPRGDVVQAQTQYETQQSTAINNHIGRAQFEHAIAVLIGKPASNFTIPPEPLLKNIPRLPILVPSELLERRPDVAQAERLMAQANAQIGIAVAAYFPTLTLAATASQGHSGLNHWFSVPDIAWAVGPQLAQTIFDGGLRKATTDAARANYDATVASYRQTVLAAFQNVEDNLSSLRILQAQAVAANKAAASSRLALRLVTNQYKAGLVDYTSVITAQTAAYTAELTAFDITGLRMTSAVGLIKALGGGWDVCELDAG
ncbi:MAG: efflux transporter outer membrane subunit [Gammaproteobacteria bacterium]